VLLLSLVEIGDVQKELAMYIIRIGKSFFCPEDGIS
jgi:hypothetical protein